MANYIEQYHKRCKCPDCQDVIWSTQFDQNIYCKCMSTSIINDVPSNNIPVSDQEMIDYINLFKEIPESITLIQV